LFCLYFFLFLGFVCFFFFFFFLRSSFRFSLTCQWNVNVSERGSSSKQFTAWGTQFRGTQAAAVTIKWNVYCVYLCCCNEMRISDYFLEFGGKRRWLASTGTMRLPTGGQWEEEERRVRLNTADSDETLSLSLSFLYKTRAVCSSRYTERTKRKRNRQTERWKKHLRNDQQTKDKTRKVWKLLPC